MIYQISIAFSNDKREILKFRQDKQDETGLIRYESLNRNIKKIMLLACTGGYGVVCSKTEDAI